MAILMKMRSDSLLLLFALALACHVAAQSPSRTRIAILNFGDASTGQRAADNLVAALAAHTELRVLDRAESRDAARGSGYNGSLNLTLAEARDLGAAMGCDFYFIGDVQTLRRSPSSGAFYYEAYASLFLVSTRSGKLVRWDCPRFDAATMEAAERALLTELNGRAETYIASLHAVQDTEQQERAHARQSDSPAIEEAPDAEIARAQNMRLPQPYRRLQPAYTAEAARYEVEAIVDVMVDLDADGEVTRTEIVRWAGYELDESTINTIRQLHFTPARRDNKPIPLRVLLRYNFRRGEKEKAVMNDER
jgi:TonB family protein